MLLEALIGILLFSLGILAVVGMQANAIQGVTQAKFRSDASFLADQVVGQIWANRNNAATYAYNGSGNPPTALQGWVQQVQARLPGATTTPPTVTVTPTVYAGPPAYTAYQISVSVFWQMPDEYNRSPRPPAHSVTVNTLIPCC